MPTVGKLFCDEAPNVRLSPNLINWDYPVVWEQLVIASCLDLLHMQLIWCICNGTGRRRGKASPCLSWLLRLEVSVQHHRAGRIPSGQEWKRCQTYIGVVALLGEIKTLVSMVSLAKCGFILRDAASFHAITQHVRHEIDATVLASS